MANRNYNNGRAREYQAVAELRARGYSAYRIAGSHGPWDVVAWDGTNYLYIQCKKDCLPTPEEWHEMWANVVPPNGLKFVYHYRSRKPLKIIPLQEPGAAR